MIDRSNDSLTPTEPTLPFLRMNDYHILCVSNGMGKFQDLDYENHFLKMSSRSFVEGKYKENACIIDSNCWKFPIHTVVRIGKSWDFWTVLWRLRPRGEIKVRYIYDTPIKLTFEEARHEIVELICKKRWYNKTQDRESQKSFRARMALCENMHDLIIGRPDAGPKIRKRVHWIGGISYYGEWVG